MGDRGNIVVLQNNNDQIWLYSHWGGEVLPEILRDALAACPGRYDDPTYLTRIIFDRMIPATQRGTETGFGIGCRIGDNEHRILVCDVPKQRVFIIEEKDLNSNGQVTTTFGKGWTFAEYAAFKTPPAI